MVGHLVEFVGAAQAQLNFVWGLGVVTLPALVGGVVYGIVTQRMEREEAY